jgi:hypothetical protein
MFFLPYTASNGSVAVSSTAAAGTVGSFITNTFPASGTNPDVVASNILLTITPTIGATTFTPLTFYADITNPAANVYCLDFATSSAGPFNSSTNCATSNPGTFAVESFDTNQFKVEVPTFLDINSPTKFTSLVVDFAATPTTTPEPVSLGSVGLALAGFCAMAIRRKLRMA